LTDKIEEVKEIIQNHEKRISKLEKTIFVEKSQTKRKARV